MGRGVRTLVAALAISAVGVLGVTQFEGFSKEAYLDSVGVPTIGYGTTEGVKLGDKITEPEARERMREDLAQFENALKQCVKVPLHQHEFDAFVSLAYNIGPGAFCKSTLVRRLNREEYGAACMEISKWVYAGGRDCRIRSNNCYGIVTRREAERALCEGR